MSVGGSNPKSLDVARYLTGPRYSRSGWLWLGISSIALAFTCMPAGLCAGIIVCRDVRRARRANPEDLSSRRNAGFVFGIIGIVLNSLGLLGGVLVIGILLLFPDARWVWESNKFNRRLDAMPIGLVVNIHPSAVTPEPHDDPDRPFVWWIDIELQAYQAIAPVRITEYGYMYKENEDLWMHGPGDVSMYDSTDFKRAFETTSATLQAGEVKYGSGGWTSKNLGLVRKVHICEFGCR